MEIGELAYEHEILTNKEGLEILKRRGKPTHSSKSVRLAMKGAAKAVTFSDLLTEAHETAAAFRSEHRALGNPSLDSASQGAQQLIGQPGASDDVIYVPPVDKEIEVQSQCDESIGGGSALMVNAEVPVHSKFWSAIWSKMAQKVPNYFVFTLLPLWSDFS